MNYRDPEFLENHIKTTLKFYHPHCIDTLNGGFYQHFKDDGSIYDHTTRHLVSSTRFTYNYAAAAHYFANDEYRSIAERGLRFVRDIHWQAESQGFAWTLDCKIPTDNTNHCYGLAFVLLASATALKANIHWAKDLLETSYELMEKRFWLEEHKLYADEASGDWSQLSPYRGQNANMHACEAIIACYEATSEEKYLDRAMAIADKVVNQLSKQCDGYIWEHYTTEWQTDWEYNKNDPGNLFRPWGIQPGHQTEWAKLLIIISRYRDADWLLTSAQKLFTRSLEKAWDNKHGGIHYGFAPDGSICDGDKYFWVQAESFAAAAAIAVKSGDDRYWEWYDKIWDYSWTHFVDHKHGAWFRILTPDNRKYDDLKSPAGKTDYHTMGACYEVLRWL